jgi:hypothetical protein
VKLIRQQNGIGWERGVWSSAHKHIDTRTYKNSIIDPLFV